VLEQGSAVQIDFMLYLDYLFHQAGIPSNMVLAFSRHWLPYHPISDALGLFGADFLLEIGPEGETPLYLLPCCLYTNFHAFGTAHQGVIAFREPAGATGDWEMFRVPHDIPVTNTYRLQFATPLPERAGDEVALRLTSTGIGAASHALRKRFGVEKADMTANQRKKLEEKKKKAVERWIDRWANIRFEGEMPAVDPKTNVDQPFVFDLSTNWTPEITDMGGTVLVPALVFADMFQNVFRAEMREAPLWFRSGRYEVSLTWELPGGATVETIPDPVEASGPGGLHFALETRMDPAGGAASSPALTTRIVIEAPPMLPATEYSGVQEFFNELQKATETRILIGNAASS
jgi:hypothetical protein